VIGGVAGAAKRGGRRRWRRQRSGGGGGGQRCAGQSGSRPRDVAGADVVAAVAGLALVAGHVGRRRRPPVVGGWLRVTRLSVGDRFMVFRLLVGRFFMVGRSAVGWLLIRRFSIVCRFPTVGRFPVVSRFPVGGGLPVLGGVVVVVVGGRVAVVQPQSVAQVRVGAVAAGGFGFRQDQRPQSCGQQECLKRATTERSRRESGSMLVLRGSEHL